MAQPQYTYDPVTQTYTRIDASAPAPVRGLGPLYNAGDGGGDSMAPSPPGPNDGRFSLSPMATEIGVGLQNIGQFTATNPVAAAFSPVTSAVTTVAGNIGNSMMGSQVSPVANPTAPVETAIAPATVGLAAMNAQTAANQNAQSNQAAVANTAESVAADVAGFADTTDAEAGAANAAAAAAAGVSDSGGVGGSDGGGGPSGDAGVSGAANEGSHSADGNNSGDTGGGGGDGDGDGDGEREGGVIHSRYAGGGVLANLFSQIKNKGLENPGGQYGMYSYDPSSQTYTRNFAEGGLASARKTEDMGRGNDTMLVHMTPNEVRGLQAIAMAHGGSLTINPKTGLVEAGFLDSILPMVAGAALAATGVGAPMAALMVGGGMTLATGSLEKGLMAGLGAFGGAGIGSALTAAGATAPAVTGTTQGLAAQGAAGAQMAASSAPTGFQAALPGLGVQTGASTAGASLAPAGSTAALQTAAAGAPQGFAANMSQMGTGLSNVVQGAPGAREAFMQSVGGPMGLATKAGPAVAGAMFSAEEPDTGKKPQEYIRPYSYDMKPSAETDADFKYRTGKPGESTAEQRYFTPTFTPMGVFKAGTEPGGSFYGTPTQEQYDLYSKPKQLGVLGLAAGGIAKGGLKDGAFVVPADVVSHLGNGSNDAGQKILSRGLGASPIKGKGDGMSDSIPTTIEGKQPARVADGEAYIPPEVVKKVGAKRLYSMMDKIRHARTGTKRQAPEVDPRKFLPA